MIKKVFVNIFPYILFSVLFLTLSYYYFLRIGAFGCGDDCNNFIGGYFLLKGEQIYSDFFFNHMPLMAHISYLVQKLSDPQSIYQLVAYHRLTLYLFSFVMGIFLIYRFRWIALLTLIVFESTKFYVFGDRFLAENFIVYPLVYLFGLTILRLTGNKINHYDYVISAVFVWFIVFMREPYIPLAVLLYAMIFLGKGNSKTKIISLSLLGILTLLTVVLIPLKDLVLNAFVYNQEITADEINKRGGIVANVLKEFFYPLYNLVSGQNTILRYLVSIISLVFIIEFVLLLKNKKFITGFSIFLILGVANIRYVTPGFMYYEAFHMVIWYGLIIFATFYLIFLQHKQVLKKIIFITPILIAVLFSLNYEGSYTKAKVDIGKEFNEGYGNYYAYGTAVKLLSHPNDTLFLEGWDDLIYWVSDRDSSYKYNWYTSLMPDVAKFKNERDLMFDMSKPDFYYDACRLLNDKSYAEFSRKIDKDYARLALNGKPSCLLVKKEKVNSISSKKWESAGTLGFSLN